MRVPALLIASIFIVTPSWAQTLMLPPRPPRAPTGSAFAASVMDLPRDAREEQIRAQISRGNLPQHIRTLFSVTVSETTHGVEHTLTYYVLPDYLSIGTDDDYILIPMTPHLAQALAETTGCVLPTRKMVNDIYRAATLKLRPQPIPPSAAMVTVSVFVQHNDSLQQQRRTEFGNVPLGVPVAGHKKDVIISNAIYSGLKPTVPRPVVIYGWHRTDGSPIQPLYNGHAATYADYSHGIRLIQRFARLNGRPVDLREVLMDPELSALVSDEGPIPRPAYEADR